jgi:hypothetical protein
MNINYAPSRVAFVMIVRFVGQSLLESLTIASFGAAVSRQRVHKHFAQQMIGSEFDDNKLGPLHKDIVT